MAGIQLLCFENKSADAAANEAAVCPEGNEKSLGAFTSSVSSGRNVKGLGRATMGLSSRLQRIRSSTREIATAAPSFLVLFRARSTTASRIQIQPASPSMVMAGTA